MRNAFFLFLGIISIFTFLSSTTLIANAGSCPGGGKYCGGSVGQNSNYLYNCTGAGANPTLYQQCATGCKVNPPGVADACNPSGPCPGSGDYCGGSVGQNSNNLYYCSGSGANPSLKQTCSSNGCQTNPSGTADVCRPSGPCPGAGDYCGGDVGQNSNNLYNCSGSGANPTLKQTCSVNGCQINPPGTADVCRPSGPCPGAGDYCGGDVGQNANNLYNCTTSGANPTLKQTCSVNGCQINPPGTADICKPSGPCPGTGDYCGGTVGQNSYNLYNCTSSGANPTLKQTCSVNGCQTNPPGTADVCKPAGACPAFGDYCGGSVGQNGNNLYNCTATGANPTLKQTCSVNGCQTNPLGTADVCKPAGACPAFGDYCGGSVGQNANDLFTCASAGANPTLKQTCSVNGCQINPPGTADVCKPAGACPGFGDYCGGSVGQNANDLFTCTSAGANPTLKQACSVNGCQTNPPGTADVCKPAGACPGFGDYCGGSVGQNANNLFTCTSAGANPTLKQTCSVNGCHTNPPGTADICKPSGPCPGAGDYCGGSVNQNVNDLYYCSATGANPTLKQTCSNNGCQTNPPGTADICKPAGACPGAGKYCGSSVNQNTNNLYYCSESGANPILSLQCSNGCKINPPGVADTCNTGSCPGYGDYCGGSVGQNTNNLYFCSANGASPQQKQICSEGCKTNPPGTADVCNTPTQPVVGNCPSYGKYCGESIGATAGTLYFCSGTNALATPSQTCNLGCQMNPDGIADACKSSSNSTDFCQNIPSSIWGGSGEYCAGDSLITCNSNRQTINQVYCGLNKCKKNTAGIADECIIEITNPNPGSGSDPNESTSTEALKTSDVSSIYWPFPDSSWSEQSGWLKTSGHGAAGSSHFGGDYYSNDWARTRGDNNENRTCDAEFKSPISGTVIFTGCHLQTEKEGTVQIDDCLQSYGQQVIVRSSKDPNFAFRIAHLNQILVSDNQTINAGDPLGKIGSTGNSTACHAHMNLYKNITDIYDEKTMKTGLDRLESGFPVGLSGTASTFAAEFKFNAVGINPEESFIFPLRWNDFKIEKDFGYGQGPINDWKTCTGSIEPNNGNKYHAGLDLIANDALGTNETNSSDSTQVARCKAGALDAVVKAIGSGTVIESKRISAFEGDRVTIKHDIKDNGKDVYSVYMHINRTVAVDDPINKGDTIGYVGNYSNNPHLHFEMRTFQNWAGGYTATSNASTAGYINPCEFIPRHGGNVPSSCPNLSAVGGGAIGSLYGTIIANFPSNAVNDDVVVNIFTLEQNLILPTKENEIKMGETYKITLTNSTGDLLDTTSQNITINLSYDTPELEDVVETSINVNFLNETSNQWETITGSLNTESRKIQFSTNKIGTYAIYATPKPIIPPTITFGALSEHITIGDSTTLEWTITGSESICTKSNGWTGDLSSYGNETITPTSTQTYTITCTNSAGSDSKSVFVEVILPPKITLNSDPPFVNAGEDHTLSWTIEGTNPVCTKSDGWSGDLVSNGSETISPTTTQTYTITCTNTAGTDSKSVTVEVILPPEVTFTADPTTLATGNSSTLTWSATGTNTTCTKGGAWSGDSPVSGNEIITPSTTGTYTITCTNSAGSDTKSVILSVLVPPSVTLSVNPTTINAGQSAKLSWTINGTALTCTKSDGWTGTLTTNGSLTIYPTITKKYTITCTNSVGSDTKSVTVNVIQAIPVVTLSANPTTIFDGEGSTLTWTISGTTPLCTKSGAWTGTLTKGGTLVVKPTSTKTYTITCTNTAGTDTKSITINVIPVAPTITMNLNPTTILAGESSTLSWTITGSIPTCIKSGAWTGSLTRGGTSVIKPTSTRTYTLTCTNIAGTDTKSITINVIQTPPTITIDATPTTIYKGESSTLAWTINGTTPTCIRSEAWTGSLTKGGTLIVKPTSTKTYTITCSNTAGTDTKSVTVTVNPVPPTVTLSANPTTVVAGGSAILSYTITGTTPTCTKSGGWTGSITTSGSATVKPTSTKTYTITCTNSSGTDTKSVTVNVN